MIDRWSFLCDVMKPYNANREGDRRPAVHPGAPSSKARAVGTGPSARPRTKRLQKTSYQTRHMCRFRRKLHLFAVWNTPRAQEENVQDK